MSLSLQIWSSGGRPFRWSLVDRADVGGDHAPAFGKAHPGLGLAADLAGRGGATKQRRGCREIAAVGRDHGLRQGAREAGRRARGAERLDLAVAVEVLAGAITDRARVVAKQRVERR